MIIFRSHTSSNKGTAVSELAPAILILFVIVLFPFVSFFSFIDGAATVYFVTQCAVRAAAAAPDMGVASNRVRETASRIIDGPLGSFTNLTPKGAAGIRLTVFQSSLTDQTVKPFEFPVDTSKYTYQYHVISDYSIKPIFYPGSPIPIHFESSSHVEHPEGLPQPRKRGPGEIGGGVFG